MVEVAWILPGLEVRLYFYHNNDLVKKIESIFIQGAVIQVIAPFLFPTL